MINVKDKANDIWILVPAMKPAVRASEVCLPLKPKWKLLGSTQEGWWKPPLHTQRHTQAPRRRDTQVWVTCSYFLVLHILHEGQEHDTESSFFLVFHKIHGNISPSENNLLWGQWSLVTKNLCLCPISKLLSAFPLHLLSALNQPLAWVLPQVLEWIYQTVWK